MQDNDERLLNNERLASIRQWDPDARPLLDHIDALREYVDALVEQLETLSVHVKPVISQVLL